MMIWELYCYALMRRIIWNGCILPTVSMLLAMDSYH
ncbi:hypothetical protein QTG54_013522 [Skeletonema marinoi]|uniref:Uncharacterized protein n=1 Tax=Skeletonema marinoi TaxID=267567 RepID=A0AAD8XXQ4_9STRA|nr:hypothetical protein QTG54_013522 [Skeletonema marinoi]